MSSSFTRSFAKNSAGHYVSCSEPPAPDGTPFTSSAARACLALPDSPSTRTYKPTLPVELLVEIIKISLPFPNGRSSPFKSPVSPHKEYASLLLASRTLRALVIPFIYRSIILAKPTDFLTFFGTGTGVFVAGPNLVEKRASLREICLVEEADFPLDLGPLARISSTRAISPSLKGWKEVNYLAMLDFSALKEYGVDTLTILSPPSTASAPLLAVAKEHVSTLTQTLELDRNLCARLISEIDRHLDDAYRTTYDRDGHGLQKRLEWAVRQFQERAMSLFLRAVRPRTIRLAPKYASRVMAPSERYVVPSPSTLRIVTYRPNEWEKTERATSSSGGLSKVKSKFPNAVIETAGEEEMRLGMESNNA